MLVPKVPCLNFCLHAQSGAATTRIVEMFFFFFLKKKLLSDTAYIQAKVPDFSSIK